MSVKDADECFQSILLTLGSVQNEYMEACSITVVPEQLRESKVEAYRPKVVSMGPLPRGTNTDLLCMEETKLRCMLHLLQRSKGSDQYAIKLVLWKCTKAMLKLDEVVRASYNVEKVRFNPNNLAKIMLVDGCFLLELLICESPHIDELVPVPAETSPGAGIIREKVLSDFTVLENQLPLGILIKLSRVLFPRITKNEDVLQKIREVALSIMGYDCATLGSVPIGFHFVELVHSFVQMEKDALLDALKKKIENENENDNNDFKIDIDRKENFRIHPKKRLQPCAARLEAAEVKIQSTGAESGSTRFDLKVTFEKGELSIPQLHITETTEAKWRNLIAWELNKSSITKQRMIKQDGFSALFISYACFLRSLICCVHDVRLLRDKGVIWVHQMETEKGKKDVMSDEDLMYLFQNMTRDIPGGEIDMDSWFAYVIKKLNSYRPPTRTIKYHATRTSKAIWHILNWFVMWIWYKCRDAFQGLIRDYIPTGWKLIAVLAATVGILLTAIQTQYTIHPTK